MSFFKVISRELLDRYNHVFYLGLKVEQGSIDIKPQYEINRTALNNNNEMYGTYRFLNKGYRGIIFTIDVVIKKAERWEAGTYWNNTKNDWDENRPYVATLLQKWIRNLVPLYVVTDAINIPNGNYLITDNSKIKQDFTDYSVWTLEFTTYTKYDAFVSKSSKSIINAKKNATKSNNNSSKKNTTASNLLKCNLNTLVYSKNKKVVTCVKYMQTILYNKGFLTKSQIDGWYGNVTANAVKKFQQKYQKTCNLKVTGKMDKATLNCMGKV